MLRHSGVAQQGVDTLRLHPMGFPSKDVQELNSHGVLELVGCFSVLCWCPHSSSSRSVGSPPPFLSALMGWGLGSGSVLAPHTGSTRLDAVQTGGRGQKNLAGHSGEHLQPSHSPKALPENNGELEMTRAKPRDNYGSWILLCIWDIIRLT